MTARLPDQRLASGNRGNNGFNFHLRQQIAQSLSAISRLIEPTADSSSGAIMLSCILPERDGSGIAAVLHGQRHTTGVGAVLRVTSTIAIRPSD
jgi:hypothetical protein